MVATTPTALPARPGRMLRATLLALAGAGLGVLLGGIAVAFIATKLFGFQLLTVKSDSMAPVIARGDLIVVKPVPITAVDVGDIVLFRSGGDEVPTVHRVVGINEVVLEVRDPAGVTRETVTDYRLVTQGDRNPLPDPGEVDADALLGTVWFTIPGGAVLGGVALQQLLLAIAVAVLLLWAAWELQRRWQ